MYSALNSYNSVCGGEALKAALRGGVGVCGGGACVGGAQDSGVCSVSVMVV